MIDGYTPLPNFLFLDFVVDMPCSACKVLWYLLRHGTSGLNCIPIKLNKSQIARATGLTRDSVRADLEWLESRQIITLKNGFVTVNDKNRAQLAKKSSESDEKIVSQSENRAQLAKKSSESDEKIVSSKVTKKSSESDEKVVSRVAKKSSVGDEKVVNFTASHGLNHGLNHGNKPPPTMGHDLPQEWRKAADDLVVVGLSEPKSLELARLAASRGRPPQYLTQIAGYVAQQKADNPAGMAVALIKQNQDRLTKEEQAALRQQKKRERLREEQAKWDEEQKQEDQRRWKQLCDELANLGYQPLGGHFGEGSEGKVLTVIFAQPGPCPDENILLQLIQQYWGWIRAAVAQLEEDEEAEGEEAEEAGED